MPARSDLVPKEFTYCLPNMLLADISYEPFRIRYRLVGTGITQVSRLDFTWAHLDELQFRDPRMQQDWDHLYRQVVARRQPVFANMPVSVHTEDDRMFEVGLFPLSTDGALIDKVVGIEDHGPQPGFVRPDDRVPRPMSWRDQRRPG